VGGRHARRARARRPRAGAPARPGGPRHRVGARTPLAASGGGGETGMIRIGSWGPIRRVATGGRGAGGVARRARRAVGCVAVAGLALVGMPEQADAHAELLSTEPAPGAQLADAPSSVVLHFSEAVDVADDTVEVLDASGERLDTGAPEHPAGDRASV